MPRHISIIFPGQGSQSIGMLDNFSSSYLDSYKDIIFDSLGFDLIDIISNGSEEKLNKTSITQPAILLSSFLQYEEFIKKLKITPNIMCGHSLGEYTALVVSQSLNLSDALSLVHKRGLLMEQCQKGSMCAVLNTDLDVISGVCKKVENVIVTGASGGVGSIAVIILNKLGCNVTAVTSKESNKEYLKWIDRSLI